MKVLQGRVAIVTGASQGIGLYIARELAKHGVRLLLAARSIDKLDALAAELRSAGHEAVTAPCDITSPEDRADLLKICIDQLGPPEILVNNAGLELGGPFHELDPDLIRNVLDVNLVSTMMLTHEVLQVMVDRGVGHVVNIASLAGKAGASCNAPYSASKFGLVGFSQSLRLEHHGTGVSVSVVCPGFVADAGMWANIKAETQIETPGMLGETTPELVARGVVRAIRSDLPEVVVNGRPVRPLLVLGALSPRLQGWLIRKASRDVFRDVSERRSGQE